MEDVEVFYLHFEEWVRNFYEVIEQEVPLFAYYELLYHEIEDMEEDESFTKEQFIEKYKNKIIAACKNYYE